MKRKSRYFLMSTITTLIVTVPTVYVGADDGFTLFVGVFTFFGVWSLQGGKSRNQWL